MRTCVAITKTSAAVTYSRLVDKHLKKTFLLYGICTFWMISSGFFYGIDNWNPSTILLAEERPMGSRLLDVCVPTCYSVRFYGDAVY